MKFFPLPSNRHYVEITFKHILLELLKIMTIVSMYFDRFSSTIFVGIILLALEPMQIFTSVKPRGK